MSKRIVAVRISGQEYRIRSDADEGALQRVAQLVDAAMGQIRDRTGTVDTLDVAVLTSLNLGRELLALRERAETAYEGVSEDDGDRLRALIELAESAIASDGTETERASLLTLPAGEELEAADDLLGSLIETAPASRSEVGPR